MQLRHDDGGDQRHPVRSGRQRAEQGDGLRVVEGVTFQHSGREKGAFVDPLSHCRKVAA